MASAQNSINCSHVAAIAQLGVTDLIDLNNVPNNKPCDNSENEVIDLSNDEQETITISKIVLNLLLGNVF
ncbi:hypothetical protein MTR_1g061650 [Medicago truncatula]|nr:hypothetical protein MTR_1g061650 [Medicago truncatula]